MKPRVQERSSKFGIGVRKNGLNFFDKLKHDKVVKEILIKSTRIPVFRRRDDPLS